MWTAWNDVVQSPQIWDILAQHDPEIPLARTARLRVAAAAEEAGAEVGAPRITADQIRLPLEPDMEGATRKAEADGG